MENVVTVMGRDTQLSQARVGSLGRALAAQLAELYPVQTIGMVAKALGTTKKAAENLLAGHLSARTITRVIEVFGPGFVAEAVMAAAGTNLEQFIDQQAADAERAAAAAREAAEKARARYENFAAARRVDPGHGGPSA